MIHAKLTDAKDYFGIHPRLDKALALLTPEFLATVGTERMELEGDKLFVTRYDYETKPEAETFFEAHRRYLDIQLMVRGSEGVGIAQADGLEEFTQKGDFWGYHGQAEQKLILKPGDFLAVFPGEGHQLKIEIEKPESVSKVVFKVLIRE